MILQSYDHRRPHQTSSTLAQCGLWFSRGFPQCHKFHQVSNRSHVHPESPDGERQLSSQRGELLRHRDGGRSASRAVQVAHNIRSVKWTSTCYRPRGAWISGNGNSRHRLKGMKSAPPFTIVEQCTFCWTVHFYPTSLNSDLIVRQAWC